MVADIRPLLAWNLMVCTVAVDVQNYCSTISFRQGVYNGNIAF